MTKCKHHSILYVEDDNVQQKNIAEFLEFHFKEVTLAANGEEALLLYQNQKFDIVLSDIEMPYMNGIRLSKEILKHNKNQKIIIISAYNEAKYFIELIKIGVHGFLQKPLTLPQMNEIFSEICCALDEARSDETFTNLPDNFKWDKKLRVLYKEADPISISLNELELFDLLISNLGMTFTDKDIFNHIYYQDSDKNFSSDAIKSLIKRLRKKLPLDIIQTHKNLGYSIKI